MGRAGFVVLIIALAILQIGVFPGADFTLVALLIATLLWGARATLPFALFAGFLLDTFAPIFGTHLVGYTLAVGCAHVLATVLLTQRSLLSVEVIGSVSFSMAYLCSALLSWILARLHLVDEKLVAAMTIPEAITFVSMLLANAVLIACAYGLLQRSRRGSAYLLS